MEVQMHKFLNYEMEICGHLHAPVAASTVLNEPGLTPNLVVMVNRKINVPPRILGRGVQPITFPLS
jgi:hypothetical protein